MFAQLRDSRRLIALQSILISSCPKTKEGYVVGTPFETY